MFSQILQINLELLQELVFKKYSSIYSFEKISFFFIWFIFCFLMFWVIYSLCVCVLVRWRPVVSFLALNEIQSKIKYINIIREDVKNNNKLKKKTQLVKREKILAKKTFILFLSKFFFSHRFFYNYTFLKLFFKECCFSFSFYKKKNVFREQKLFKRYGYQKQRLFFSFNCSCFFFILGFKKINNNNNSL